MAVKQPIIGYIASLAASGEVVIGDVTLVRLETLTVTTNVTYNAAATSGVRLKLYFSPDSKHYDTVPYAYYDIDLTAGATVQETQGVDAPEKGHLRVAVANLDAAQAATDIRVWVGVVEE